jgi:hypothetical protein
MLSFPSTPSRLSADKKEETLLHREAGSLLWCSELLLALFRVLFLEPFDTPFGIDDFLRPGKEWVAIRANIDIDIADGRARFELVPTGAMDCGFPVDRVNPFFHDHRLLTSDLWSQFSAS